ncbi:MAG: phosphoglycerate kinase [Brumimicrobium sp.]|nr:phosphoglycerate kinase [Brumimicrobium sp.]
MNSFKSYNFENKRALIRVDFNVPLNSSFQITDDTRIQSALPTINHILKNKGSVILMSHLGRPKSGPEEKFSLKHLIPRLNELLNTEVIFLSDCIGEHAFSVTRELSAGKVVLLENLRFYDEETAGDLDFAKKLSNHGNVYVNDAFGTAHREHASTAVIARFFPEDKLFGLLLEKEINNIDKVLKKPDHPTTAIIGGAKVSSKITIIDQLLDTVDNIIIGGGMAYTFVKAQGGQTGNSLVEDDYLETARNVLKKAKEKNTQIHIPSDSVIADKFADDANKRSVKIDEIPEGWMGLDIGNESIKRFREVISGSKTILWNGPMGVFEMESFQTGTVAVAQAIAEATKNGAYSLIGGGDSVAAINQFGLADQVSYISTGGGAMLEYLEGKELPGIAAIRS